MQVSNHHFLPLLGSKAHESLISGHFPASEETLQHLAALRLQYLHGDGAGRAGWNLGTVYPIGRLRNRIMHSTKPGVGVGGGAGGPGGGGSAEGRASLGGQGVLPTGAEKRKTPSFLDGTLRRSFKTGSLKKQKVSEEGKFDPLSHKLVRQVFYILYLVQNPSNTCERL